MSPLRRVHFLVLVGVSAFLAGVGYALAAMHREIVALSPGHAMPPFLVLIWICYAITIAIFGFALGDRPR